jgi:putative SOS response-associated peptidase YedK
MQRRCLVPADCFFEWQRLDPKLKRPFAIGLKSGDPRLAWPLVRE